MRSTIFNKWEDYVVEILNVLQSVRKPYLRASYHVYKICCFLVRGISLPATQLFVIAIENILRGRCGQLQERCLLHSCVCCQVYCYAPLQTLTKVSFIHGRVIWIGIQMFGLSPKSLAGTLGDYLFTPLHDSSFTSPKDPTRAWKGLNIGQALSTCIAKY